MKKQATSLLMLPADLYTNSVLRVVRLNVMI